MTRLKLRITMLIALLLALVPTLVLADGPQSIPPFVVAIPPYGVIEVAVRGNCLNYGLPFPGTTLAPVGVADDKVRLAIVYSLENGYHDQENLAQSQAAIWSFTDGLDISGEDNAVAREVAEYAQSGASPKDIDAGVTAFMDALGKGWIKVTLNDFANVSDPPYFGEGMLVIANKTDATVNVNMPYGVVFEDTTQDGVQDMALFPADLPAPDPELETAASREFVCHPLSVKVPANESIDVLINGYCLDYGAPFPGKSLRPLDLAPEVIRNTICYNLSKGYVEQDIWQAQLAVWRQTDGLDKGSEFPLVDEIATYAESGVEPGDIGENCKSLADAVEDGTIAASIDDFENTTDPEYFGKGTMVLTNQTGSDQDICVPYGMVFTDEAQDGVQDMGVYPAQNPDPNDLEEPEVLPDTGGALAGSARLAILLLAVGLFLAGGGYVLRRASVARSRLV